MEHTNQSVEKAHVQIGPRMRSGKVKLSRSQSAVLACLKKNGSRMLPKDTHFEQDESASASVWVLGVQWEWSWTISQEAHTSDYRRRIYELRERGYWIAAFHAGNRHGYAYICGPTKESEAA